MLPGSSKKASIRPLWELSISKPFTYGSLGTLQRCDSLFSSRLDLMYFWICFLLHLIGFLDRRHILLQFYSSRSIYRMSLKKFPQRHLDTKKSCSKNQNFKNPVLWLFCPRDTRLCGAAEGVLSRGTLMGHGCGPV